MRQLRRACATSNLRSLCYPQHLCVAQRVPAQHTSKRFQSDNTSSEQAFPFKGYYEDSLDAPLHSISPATRTAPAPPPHEELPKTEKEKTVEKGRIVFGSRLAGPAERRHEIEKASQNVAGIMVPPRPEEPDNCCMSGCVNCVWDRYRDEIEEWAEASARARAKVQEQRLKGNATGMMAKDRNMPAHVAISMDDDGGGSETNWTGEGGMESFGLGEGGADLFAGIPVGIREFMKTEKKLKERRKREKAMAVND